MNARLVPAKLVFDEGEVRVNPEASAFMEFSPTPEGISMKLIINQKGNQADACFNGHLPPKDLASIGAGSRVEVLVGDCDDVVFLYTSPAGAKYEAPTCFGRLVGLIEDLYEVSDFEPEEDENDELQPRVAH